jgi:NADPH:quinone reductase-like Zn-dependent oxidoreductase
MRGAQVDLSKDIMQAIRVHPPKSESEPPYSASNPALSTALVLDNISIPTLSKPGQLLIRVHATSVTRAELTWPETYGIQLPMMGYDLAGTVVAVQEGEEANREGHESGFKPGDEVFGLLDMKKGSTWAEFAIARTDQVAAKPETLSWAESAAVPLSALTAWQALFVIAGVEPPDFSSIDKNGLRSRNETVKSKKIAVTGATGAVGIYLVQLAALAGLHVVALCRSNASDEDFLRSLGANEVIEYKDLGQVKDQFDIIIDGVGGEILQSCWASIKDDGTLISIESDSADFVRRHRGEKFTEGKHSVRALFFIVEPSGKQLEELSVALNRGLLKVFVAQEMPLHKAREAYELANGRLPRRGKVILTI